MKRTAILLVIFSCCISLNSFSQDKSDLINYPGKWIYTNDNLSNEWYGERFYKMNPAELQKYHQTTDKLVNYLQQQPVAQNPLGVTLNVKSRAAYDYYDHESHPVIPTERVKAEIYIPFCSLIHEKDKIEYACTEVSYIKLRTNDQSKINESVCNFDLLDDSQALLQYREISYVPKKLLDLGSGVYLYDWYYDNCIVVARADRPIWIPITNREYIRRMLIYYTASLKEGKIPQMVIDALQNEIAAIPPDWMDRPAYLNGNNERPLTQICSMEEDSTTALCRVC